MKTRHFFAAQILVLLILGGTLFAHARPDSTSSEKKAPRSSLEGTWQLVSYKYRDAAQFTEVSKDEQTHLKHFAGGHFIWVDYDPKTKEMRSAAGGTCTLEGNVLKETPQYGMGTESADMRDIEQTFTIKLEGNTYHQSGILQFGGKHPETMKLEEVWERVR